MAKENNLKEQRDALLEACESLLEGYSETDRQTWASDIVAKAEAAIAKAKE